MDEDAKEQILNLIDRLCKELNLSCVFVTHDLEAAKTLCHDFCIMHEGEIVERGGASAIFNEPKHGYTKLLIESTVLCAG